MAALEAQEIARQRSCARRPVRCRSFFMGVFECPRLSVEEDQTGDAPIRTGALTVDCRSEEVTCGTWVDEVLASDAPVDQGELC